MRCSDSTPPLSPPTPPAWVRAVDLFCLGIVIRVMNNGRLRDALWLGVFVVAQLLSCMTTAFALDLT